MTRRQHPDVRTTVTLDEDVAAKLKSEARRSGRPFREIVNEALRRGFVKSGEAKPPAFKVAARDLGELRAGLSLDCIADL